MLYTVLPDAVAVMTELINAIMVIAELKKRTSRSEFFVNFHGSILMPIRPVRLRDRRLLIDHLP